MCCVHSLFLLPSGAKEIGYSRFKKILDYMKHEDKSMDSCLQINAPFGLSVHVQFTCLRIPLSFCITVLQIKKTLSQPGQHEISDDSILPPLRS